MRHETKQRRCWGRTRNLRRCGRWGNWKFFCQDHKRQWIPLIAFLLFTAGGGSASIYSVFTTAQRNEPSPRGDIFHARLHTAMIFGYPGWLLYVYESKFGKRLAPVGYSVVIEVTNTGSIITKIQSYTLDIAVKGEWVRLPNLQPLNPTAFFWANNGNLQTSRQLDFRENNFDSQARDRSLSPGESIRGWMFFEWPPELRDTIPKFNRIRLQLENTIGIRVIVSLDTEAAQEPGQSLLGGGEWRFGQLVNVDLSQYPILPHSDLLKGFKSGTLR